MAIGDKKINGPLLQLLKVELFKNMEFPNKEISSILEQIWWFIKLHSPMHGYYTSIDTVTKVLDEAGINAPAIKINTLIQRGIIYYSSNALLAMGDKYMTDAEFAKWRMSRMPANGQQLAYTFAQQQQMYQNGNDRPQPFQLQPNSDQKLEANLKFVKPDANVKVVTVTLSVQTLELLEQMQKVLDAHFGFVPSIEQVLEHCIKNAGKGLAQQQVFVSPNQMQPFKRW
jgi:hypothetical protein